MQFTQAQVDWYNEVVTVKGQMTHDQAMAALQAAMAPQAQAAPVAVEQPATVMQGTTTPQNDPLGILANIANLAASEEDHAAILSGKPPRAGLAFIRVLSYVEIGVHQGKNTTHAPKPGMILTVELHHPDHLVEENGIKVPRTLDIRLSKTHSNNSKFPKFFKALARALGNNPATGAPITHLSQAIGMGCLAEIYHNKSDDKVYANLDLEGSWSFKSSTYVDPQTGQQQTVDIPPLHGKPMLFMMENKAVNDNPEAVKAMWDSIYIPGIRKYKDAQGADKEASNNRLQEIISKGLEWKTAPIKRILDSLGCVTDFGLEPERTPAGTPEPTQAGGIPLSIPAQVQQVPAQVQAQVPTQAPAVEQAPVQAAPQLAPVQAATVQAAPVAATAPAPVAAPQQQPAIQPAAGGMSAESFMQQFAN